MEFLKTFKDTMKNSVKKTIETSVKCIGQELNDKMEERFKDIDLGVKEIKEQVKKSDEKQSDINKIITE